MISQTHSLATQWMCAANSFQGFPGLLKAIQTYSRVFQKKKIVYFLSVRKTFGFNLRATYACLRPLPSGGIVRNAVCPIHCRLCALCGSVAITNQNPTGWTGKLNQKNEIHR
jgi:hypothetical protein